MAEQFRYPWEEWFSKPKFTLKKGKDYRCRTDTMAGQIRNKVRGKYKVSIEVADDAKSLTVTVLSDLTKGYGEEE